LVLIILRINIVTSRTGDLGTTVERAQKWIHKKITLIQRRVITQIPNLAGAKHHLGNEDSTLLPLHSFGPEDSFHFYIADELVTEGSEEWITICSSLPFLSSSIYMYLRMILTVLQ
jgi:hypothetical protein